MEVVGVGVDKMTAQLRGLEGKLRPVRQPHATQPHGPAVLHSSLAGPGHPPSLTDLEASEPSSGLGAAVSDLLAIQNTRIPLPTPTPPAPVVHAHEAPLMDLPLAAPILQEPFHPSPMETDLIFRPCASDADVGAPLRPTSPHPSPSPAPPITTADSSEGTATAGPTDTATSPDEVVRCPTCLSSLANRRALRHHMPFCHPADAARRAQTLRGRASALPSLAEPRAQGMQFTDAQGRSLDSVQWSEYFAPTTGTGVSRVLEARALESVQARHTNPLDLARLTSLQGGGAGAWLMVVPYADSLRIPEAQWQVASAFRLGLPIPQLALAGQCSYGQAIDDMTVPHHVVRCSRFGVATVIHDTVKYMLRDFASEAGFAVKVEDTTLILHLEAARARLQGLSGTGYWDSQGHRGDGSSSRVGSVERLVSRRAERGRMGWLVGERRGGSSSTGSSSSSSS
ncbi:unnamed protein product [Closterium sp. NIES-64]|nr:unnamed protein product [Closterium sp. NIES-64]